MKTLTGKIIPLEVESSKKHEGQDPRQKSHQFRSTTFNLRLKATGRQSYSCRLHLQKVDTRQAVVMQGWILMGWARDEEIQVRGVTVNLWPWIGLCGGSVVLDDWVLVNLGLGILAEIYGVISSFLTDIISFLVIESQIDD